MLSKNPTSKTVSEASALLSLMGGPSSEVKKTLDRLMDYALRNEAAVDVLKQEKKAAEAAEALSKKAAIEAKKELESLATKKKEFQQEISETRTKQNDKAQVLAGIKAELDAREKDIVARQKELDKKIKDQMEEAVKQDEYLGAREASCMIRENHLQDIVAKMSTALGELNKLTHEVRSL